MQTVSINNKLCNFIDNNKEIIKSIIINKKIFNTDNQEFNLNVSFFETRDDLIYFIKTFEFYNTVDKIKDNGEKTIFILSKQQNAIYVFENDICDKINNLQKYIREYKLKHIIE